MGHAVEKENVLEDVKIRDEKDTGRDIAPLRKAEDAVVLDSTGMTLDQVVDRMMAEVERKSFPKC